MISSVKQSVTKHQISTSIQRLNYKYLSISIHWISEAWDLNFKKTNLFMIFSDLVWMFAAITLDNENILSKMFPRAGEFFVGGVCTLAFTYLTTKLYLVDLNNKFDDFRFISAYVLSDYEELYDVFYGSILLQQRQVSDFSKRFNKCHSWFWSISRFH